MIGSSSRIELDPNLKFSYLEFTFVYTGYYLLYVLSAGHASARYASLRAASDPVRSYLSIVQFVRSRAVCPYLL